MKAFRYSLQRLLDAKLSIEEGRRAQVAAALRELARENQCLHDLLAEADQVAGRNVQRKRDVTTHDLELASRYVAHLRRDAAACAQRVASCEHALAERRAELAKTVMERRSLEKLRDHEQQTWLQQMRRLEQMDLDEAASGQHLRKRREASSLERILAA